jgi:putative ABC transport system substrate-binding protein
VLGAGRWTASAAGLAVLGGGCRLINPPAPSKVRRIGYLYGGSRSANEPSAAAFLDQLRQFGWVDGQNLAIEWRIAEGRDEQLANLAADLVRQPVELIFAIGSEETLAAKHATSSLPIVMAFASDPVAEGLIESLGRPGSNVTGTETGSHTFAIKAIELLKSTLPPLTRLAVLADLSNVYYTSTITDRAQITQASGIQHLDLEVTSAEDVDRAFDSALAWSAEALLLMNEPSFTTGVDARVVDLAAHNRLPAMYTFNPAVTENGGLMAFGTDLLGGYRQGAEYVDKILRGANPADLPVEEPRQFSFIVNVKAAQALGITFPPDAAAQVTQWVQ